MASITMGMASSHSPMLSTAYDDFEGHAERDRNNPAIEDFDGLVNKNRERMEAELRPDVTRQRYEETQAAIETLGRELADADLDALIVVGDDQGEWFSRDDMPALAIYWGETVENRPPSIDHMKPSLRSAYAGFHGDGQNRQFPVHSDIGRELVHGLTEGGFDVHQIRQQPPEDVPFGHAWGFVHQRLMGDAIIPIVPIMLNTYFPPNQPTPTRCWDLGQAVREVIESLPGSEKIGILGSGGLSHFVVDEEQDRRLLAALGAADRDAVSRFTTEDLQSGNSEGRNWIVTGGASTHLSMDVVSYVPYYRSLAGSGCGMAFAVWK